ncbi:killer cell lectin-like receptor subfamily B member 1B allele A [Indicator indicator]|uniref:killer cell lectin-like receptor subfamily B member 1B allele A n=1 Tax=Indicator indicator TaxID=1002788 RepID=UPI0023E049A0|nr:killer cell lectin-like receptor subfamily B member 1B allele A [Indicator indicator]
MSETLIYADLNLPESARPRLQITDVQGSTYAQVKVQSLDTNPEASYTSAGKICCSRTCVAGLVAVILLLLVLAVCLILISCPKNWERNGKKCYFFHKTSKRNGWNVSHEECTKMGANLVVIENKEELDYLALRSECCYYLLGLRYSESEEKWKWINGVEHSTDMFEIKGEPDYFCAVIRKHQVERASCTGDSTTQNMCEKAASIS